MINRKLYAYMCSSTRARDLPQIAHRWPRKRFIRLGQSYYRQRPKRRLIGRLCACKQIWPDLSQAILARKVL
jgi:hypothetical protein